MMRVEGRGNSGVVPVLLVLCLSLVVASCAAHVRFPTVTRSGRVEVAATLQRPDGTGPFPAVVLLHTCAGLGPYAYTWASWLQREGYAALVVDSFSAPGRLAYVCGVGRDPSVSDVARDALGALAYLRSLPFVDHERVALMGWSYGAEAALEAGAHGGLRAIVAFYPWCGYGVLPLPAAPSLLLLAEADTDSPPQGCVEVAIRAHQAGLPVWWTVYPGAHHGFDMAELGTRGIVTRRGHTMRYDPKATADAEQRIRAFLSQHLRDAALR